MMGRDGGRGGCIGESQKIKYLKDLIFFFYNSNQEDGQRERAREFLFILIKDIGLDD